MSGRARVHGGATGLEEQTQIHIQLTKQLQHTFKHNEQQHHI